MFGIIKVEASACYLPSQAKADNTQYDLDNSAYHKNQIQ